MQGPRPATVSAHIDEYRLVRPLDGDARFVFLAHDRALDRAVVLRFLPLDGEEATALLEGARALARVSHRSLCPVYRIREAGERPCVVQGFAQGERLDAVAVPLPRAQVLDIGRSLAGALVALHGAGVAHGDVRAERIILAAPIAGAGTGAGTGVPRLFGLRGARAVSGADRAPASGDPSSARGAFAGDVRSLLALLVHLADADLREWLGRLAETDGETPGSEEVLRRLETLARPSVTQDVLAANPYRGLQPFESEHAALFFGRQTEVSEALVRLGAEPWLVIAGRSGAGKSSLVRAGVLPAIAEGALGERARWDVATVVPGRRPFAALAAALAPIFERDTRELETALRAKPALAGRLARRRTEAGLVLLIDQAEELATLVDTGERDAFFSALASFRTLSPGVRAILTLRSDFLDRLGALGTLGRDLLRATFVLPPMRAEGLRQAIVAPARTRGFEMETAAMVDALVNESEAGAGADALPLLSFALAELWTERDRQRRLLPELALTRLGGAAAALARHGDMVLASLGASERREARRILLALVTSAETRGRRTREELIGADEGGVAASALEALIRGRLIVAGDTCEIAHEALVRAWPRLRGWLDDLSGSRAAAARLAAAAREWDRLGRQDDALWSTRQARDLDVPGALDGADESALAFAKATRRGAQRRRRRFLVAAVSVPLAVAVGAGSITAASAARHRGAVAAAVTEARALGAIAEDAARQAGDARTEAFTQFDRNESVTAEATWKRALALEEALDRRRRDVGAALDRALALDPHDRVAHDLYADLIFARLLAAERLHDRALLRELRGHLQLHDDGTRAARLSAPGRLRVATDPPGATLTLARYDEDAGGQFTLSAGEHLITDARQSLPPGSYLIVAEAPGRVLTRYPFVLRREEDLTLNVVLPLPSRIPAGMIYVPAGRSSYGSGDDEALRVYYTHQPIHDVEVGAFFIARTEVTNGDYLAYVRALPAGEQRSRLPISVTFGGDGGGAVLDTPQGKLAEGERECNPHQGCEDWSRFPVDGVSQEDGVRYAAWLSQSRRLVGARLCTDREWERAARGADGRRYPEGNAAPGPEDACTLDSYGGDERRAGPCAVGTHPAVRSLFGVDDITGNEWEWTATAPDVSQPTRAIIRGASWVDAGIYVALSNRGYALSNERIATDGLRICAD